MVLKLTNNATSTLAASISESDTTLAVQSADAGKFPTLSAGEWFPVTLVDAAGNMEVMRCTARASATLTVERAQEGSTAKAFDVGSRVDLRLTNAALAEFAQIDKNLSDLTSKPDARENLQLDTLGVFIKADPYAVAFTKTGNGTVSIKAGTIVEVDGRIYTFASATAVTMPGLTAGTDYAIWILPDGSLEATTDFSTPPLPGARRLGGFHYAPGGNATAYNSGGNTTPQINEFSLWDIKFRPSCPDPRGMALVANSFWCDIYLLGVNHHNDGTSKYNVTIADGSSPPKVPTMFGGNGSTTYSSLNWWEAAEVMQSHGKELLSYAEFAAAMYGTKEAQSGGTDPVTTILRADYTSIWGIMLATGNMHQWGREFGGDHAASSWDANTGGRGSTHTLSNAARFGGYWDNDAGAGSRASSWSNLPAHSGSGVGARGRSDHLNHV